MIKYLLLIVLGVTLYVLSQTKNQQVFNKDVYRVYKDLKKELRFAAVHGDQYDNARNFLTSQGLQDKDLEKLQTLININLSNNNLITQVRTIMATVALTIVTLAFGTIFSAALGGMYSKYVELVLEPEDYKKIETLFNDMDATVNLVGQEFAIITVMFFVGLSIWRLCVCAVNQTNVILQKIVSDEIQDRKKTKIRYRASK